MPQTREELNWWLNCLDQHNGNSLQIRQWDLVIETDASTQGWNKHGRTLDKTGKREPHKLFAAFLALKWTHIQGLFYKDGQCDSYCLCEQDGGNPLIILVKPGSRGMEMVYRKVKIHAEHLPGKEHVQADWQSRHCRDSSDWKLDE